MTRFLGYHRVLIVTAVEAERAAVLGGLSLDRGEEHASVRVIVGGVGPAAAAAATATAVAIAGVGGSPFDAVLSAGIGGGFAGYVAPGGLAIATESIAADLGADAPEGFIDLDQLGYGSARHGVDPGLLTRLTAALPDAATGPILTVSTVTGTAEGTAARSLRHPDAVAEAMEGFGVATGGDVYGPVAFGELRAISNAVGPRDRAAWRIPRALATLRAVFAALTSASSAAT